MDDRLTLLSPAKLNLFFRVLKRRPDGYHEISSLYQAIDLCDTLTLSLAEKETFSCNVFIDSSNLVLRVADLFREKTGIDQPFSFKLEKKIPLEAGLGGGSSNAATALWGLNQLMQTGIDEETLTKWAAELGADVAFFFSHGRAYCEGIGEILTPLPPVEAKPLWIAKPKAGLSTKAVFQALNLESLDSHALNDLENVAFKLVPPLKQLKADLFGLGFERVQMTGSGTAFFCFGSIKQPQLVDTTFFPARFLYRNERSWYKI
ncbi:MAG: 4-diphosphocytidyl-2-C-methyl-D-erythritol kinase [Chlamydiae bacterium]|nr:4-diphosphocytidyl-2-C-methyl-D-erythritol kinase [Chlamydiota bacterium]